MKLFVSLMLGTFLVAPTRSLSAAEEKVIISYSSRDFSFLPGKINTKTSIFTVIAVKIIKNEYLQTKLI